MTVDASMSGNGHSALPETGKIGRSASKSFEGLVDHPGRPQQALEDREDVFPEAVCLLPEPHPGSEDAKGVDRAAANRDSPRVFVGIEPVSRVPNAIRAR